MANLTRRRSRQKLSTVSLTEVAAHAEVSTATVSRVLNNSAVVSEDVRRKVERACQELGYVPNGAARALSSSRTMTIGAVVPTIENSGFALTVSSLQRHLNKAGYTLLLASSDYEPEEELREARTLLMRGVDGIMLVGSDHHPQLLSLIEQHTVPFVETWTLAPGRPSVGFDNAAAAYELTEHIVALGHRRIGLIAGRTSSNDRSSAREAGVRACLKAHGLTLASEWFIERPYRILDGQQAMRRLIERPNRPTAVICGNDQMAFGALIEASHQGKGYGRAGVAETIKMILARYPQCRAVRLTCFRANTNAAALYESMGFEPTGEVDSEFGEPNYALKGASLDKFRK